MTPQDIIRRGTAIVTGGGSGLGRALAAKLAGQGVTTIVLGRGADALAQTQGMSPEKIIPMVCDVSDAQAVRDVFSEIAVTHGTPRVLINNAAVYPKQDVLDLSPGALMETVAINLGGVVACCEAALQHMVEDGIGRILNVSTFADIAPLPMSSQYSVSKGAARIYTRALIADIADRFPDIVVGDWMPGMLDTQMGISDGLAPMAAASWGVSLALQHDPSLTGAIFEMDKEILTGAKWKRHVKAWMTLRSAPKPRIIAPV